MLEGIPCAQPVPLFFINAIFVRYTCFQIDLLKFFTIYEN